MLWVRFSICRVHHTHLHYTVEPEREGGRKRERDAMNLHCGREYRKKIEKKSEGKIYVTER